MNEIVFGKDILEEFQKVDENEKKEIQKQFKISFFKFAGIQDMVLQIENDIKLLSEDTTKTPEEILKETEELTKAKQDLIIDHGEIEYEYF